MPEETNPAERRCLVGPEFLARLKQWDNLAWTEFLDRVTPFLLSRARRTVRAQYVDEVVADTIENLLLTIHLVDRLTLAYLAKGVFFASRRYQRLKAHSDLGQQLNLLAQDCAPDRGIEQEEAFSTVKQWWRSLSDFQREVLACRYLSEMTLKETAQVLGAKIGRVHYQEVLALRSLLAALRGEGFDQHPESAADLSKLADDIFRLLSEAVPGACGDDDQEPSGTSECGQTA